MKEFFQKVYVERSSSNLKKAKDNLGSNDIDSEKIAPISPDAKSCCNSFRSRVCRSAHRRYLHQVSFLVVVGASVSPSWSLAQFKGPGANGNLASIARTRTHLLTLALGPRTGNPIVSEEQNRVIINQNLIALRPQ